MPGRGKVSWRWRLVESGIMGKALREYQQALIDAYYDNWMKEMLEPLYQAFQQWKQGKLKQIIACIKMDNEWFAAWLRDNPPPHGVEL